MSESVYLVLVPLVLLLALRCLSKPTYWSFGTLGLGNRVAQCSPGVKRSTSWFCSVYRCS